MLIRYKTFLHSVPTSFMICSLSFVNISCMYISFSTISQVSLPSFQLLFSFIVFLEQSFYFWFHRKFLIVQFHEDCLNVYNSFPRCLFLFSLTFLEHVQVLFSSLGYSAAGNPLICPALHVFPQHMPVITP